MPAKSQAERAKPAEPQDQILVNFAAYVKTHGIYINPAISLHRFPGRGFGIRASSEIPAKTRLMHMPTDAIVKWSDIPEDFLPRIPPPAVKGGIRVHSRLASWLAFSNDVKENQSAWMATWPALEDFKTSMPGLWPERCQEIYFPKATQPKASGNSNGAKKKKVQKEEKPPGFAILPTGVTGRWATLPQTSHHDILNKPPGILASQQTKLEGDLAAAAKYFPELNDRSSAECQKFLHAWCCVNTRCFYHWPTWPIRKPGSNKAVPPPPAPEDRDEAMAMCPGMDFFNHTSDEEGGLCCSVLYDKLGFTVMSPSTPVKEGEELFLSYGPHGEEDLWVEYGFMLGGDVNEWDGINIDLVVISDRRLGKRNRELLRERSYNGDYTLRRDGVCWRTEIAARKCILGEESWRGFVDGTYEETEVENTAAGEVIEEWIMKVNSEAKQSRNGLSTLTRTKAVELFSRPDDGNDQERLVLAQARKAMCLGRWEQIGQLCESALSTLYSRARDVTIRASAN